MTENIIIDGVAVPVSAGQTIMEVACAAGIYIPHLCYHPDLTPAGNCRLCTVLVDGKPVAACITQAHAGQVVENSGDDLRRGRETLIEMLFAESNHFCPHCEKSGNCDLQASAYLLGMDHVGFTEQFPRRHVDASHPAILLDRDRCIFCGLCVRASREADGKNVFELANRGADTELIVNSPSGLLADSDLSADDVAARVCPVGVILPKQHAYEVPIGERRFDHEPISSVGNVSALAKREEQP